MMTPAVTIGQSWRRGRRSQLLSRLIVSGGGGHFAGDVITGFDSR